MTTLPLRSKLCSSTALAVALLAMPRQATAAAFAGSPVVTSGTAAINRATTNLDRITVGGTGGNTAVITWTPTDTTGSGAVNFLPSGATATFSNAAGVTDFTVINRVLPTNATGALTNRPTTYNGAINSFINSAGVNTPGGTVVFYTPGGIIIGPTAVINVGSLLLTTADPVLSGSTFTLNSALNSTSSVQIAAGAQVNAQSNYVALVAPRIAQGGAVTVAGGAAYIAAEQVDLTISAGKGLFDIKIGAGSAKATTETAPITILSHTGTTTGATPAAGTSPTIIMAAIPKNDAITMLVGGTVGFTPATSATVSGGTVELLAGVPTTENMTTAVSLRNGATVNTAVPASLDISASSTTNLYGEATTRVRLSPSFTGQIGLTQNLTGTVSLLGRSQTVVDTMGNNRTVVGGDLDLGSQGDSAGRQASVNANIGTMTVGGGLNVDLFSHGFGTTQTGGTVGIAAAGGKLVVGGGLTIDTSAAAYSGQGQGGTVGLQATASGTLQVGGDVFVNATGTGNGGIGGTGGSATLNVSGSSLYSAGTTRLSVDGGVNYGTGTQTAQGGTAAVTLGAAGSVNSGTLLLSANGNAAGGGASGRGGAASLTIAPGTASVGITDNITIDASGFGGTGSTGTGGTGTGGQATIAVQGGTLSLQGGSANFVSVNAGGTGGQGGYNGNYDGSAGFNGGQGTGGTASFIVSGGGRALVTDLGVTADGTGGAGNAGAYASYGQPAGPGGVGGNGTGGTATLGVGGSGSLLTLTGPSSTFGGLTVRASGTGGQGGDGQTNSPPDDQGAMGGMGGSAFGGTASVLVNLGGEIVGQDSQQLNVVAGALPGFGGNGAFGNVTYGAPGSSGLQATGGNASLTLNQGMVSFDDLVRVWAPATPVGGTAQGGTATLALSNGASLNAGNVIVDATPSIGQFTAAIGGTAAATIDNSALVAPTMSVTAGVTAETEEPAPASTVRGGTATLDIRNAGTLSVGTLALNAAADATQVFVFPGQTGVGVTGGTAALTLASGAQLNANDVEITAFANAGPATSVTAGSATIALDGATLNTLSLGLDASGTITGPGAAVLGGTAALDVGASGTVGLTTLQLKASADASSVTVDPGQTAPSATGGTTRLTIAAGSATVTADQISLSADASGGSALSGIGGVGVAGAGTGGTATIAVGGGSLTSSGSNASDTVLTANATGGAGTLSYYPDGSGNAGASGGAATGGTVSFSVTGAGQATLNNLQLSAAGTGGAGGGADFATSGTGATGGDGGAGTGGMATVSVTNGATLTLTGPSGGVNGLSLAASGSGGSGGAGGGIGDPTASPPYDQTGFGGAGGMGGAATGGTASVLVDANGTIIGQGTAALAIAADAYSGYGGYGGIGNLNDYTNIGPAGAGGLSAQGGTATLTVSNGASLTLPGSVRVEATAYGYGPGATGGAAALNLLGGSITVGDISVAADATSDSGGSATAGSAGITINGGPSNLSTTLSANDVTVTAAGGSSYQTGTYSPAVAITGGTAAFDLGATGQATINSLQLSAGGDASFGAAGATGQGGTARLTIAAGDATLTVSDFIGLDASGYGANGGFTGTGGPGFGGNAGVFIAGGTLTLSGPGAGALSIGAGGTGGPGYFPADPVDGGAATGGTAQFAVSGAAVVTLPALTLSAGAVGGDGAPGFVLPSNVADAGGAGGLATGGTASFSATDSAQVTITGKLSLQATAQGGYGGIGANGPDGAAGADGTPAEGTSEGPPVTGGAGGNGGAGGDGGSGGVGGAAIGGTTSLAATNGVGSGAQVVLGTLAMLSTATAGGGGDGGMGGAGGAGGMGGAGANGGAAGATGATGAVGNGGAGGQGGDVTGGSVMLNVANASLSTGATQIDATVVQTLGGAYGADGNGNAPGYYAGYGNINTGPGASLTMAGATPVALGDPVTIDAAGPILISAGATDAGFTAGGLEATSNTSIVSNAPLGVDSVSFTGNDVLGIGIPVSIGGAINATGTVAINTTGAVAIDAPVMAYELDAQTNAAIEVSGDLTLTNLSLQTFGYAAPITLTGNTSVASVATIAAPGAISLDGPFTGASGSTLSVTSETSIEASQTLAAGSITLTGDAPGTTVSLTGNTQAAAQLAIAAQGAVTLGGQVGATDLTASSDTSIAVTGQVAANTVALTGNPGTGAMVDVAASGSIAGGDTVALSGSGAVTVEGAVGGSALTLNSDSSIASTGTLSGDTLDITGTAPGATIALGGTSAITGATTLTAPGAITVSGSQQTGSFAAASDTGIIIDGTIAATNGATTLTGNLGTTAGVTVTANGALTGGATTITAPGAVLLNGGITGTDVVLASDTSVTSTAGIGATTLTVTGTAPGATVTLAGANTVSGATMVAAPGAVALSGQLLGGGSLTASSDTSVDVAYDQLTASALTLTGTAPGATVSLGGNSTVSGTTALTAPGAITVAGEQQAGPFTAASDTGITVTGAVAATAIALTGNSGTAATVAVASTGSLMGTTSATITAPGAVTLAGAVAAPTVTVSSATGIAASGMLAATTLGLTGTGPGSTVTLDGSTAVTGAATITAPGAVTLTGAFTGGGSLAASSATSVSVADSQLVATGLTLTGTGAGSTVSLGGVSTVVGTTALTAPGQVTVAGSQQARTFTAASGSQIAVNGAVAATNGITLTGNSGTTAGVAVAFGGSLAGNTTITAPGLVLVDGSITGPTVALSSGTRVSAVGPLAATTLTVTGTTPAATVDLANATVTGSATINGPGGVSLSGTLIGGGSYAVRSATSIIAGGLIRGSALTLTGAPTSLATITLGGTADIGGATTITSPGAVTLNGAITGGGTVSASSATRVAVNDSQLVASALTLTGTAPASTVSLAGNSTVSGTTSLTAPGAITVAGSQQAGTFAAASGSGIAVTGAIAATDITLTSNSGTTATVGVSSTGSLTGSNSVTVTAPGAVTLDGAVTAPTLAVSSATSIESSAALTGGVITITGTTPASTVTLTGALTDTGTATIIGPGGVALSGSFAGGGALSATSNKLIAVNYGQLNASALTLSAVAPGGSIILAGNTTVTGVTMLQSSAALVLGGVQQAGAFRAASDTGITAPGSIAAATIALTGNPGTSATVGVTSTGSLAGTTSATVTAPGAVTLAGAITAPTVSVSSGTAIAASGTLSGTTIALTGTGSTSTVTLTGTLNDAGTATIVAPGAVALSGMFTGGGALNASSAASVAINYPQFNASGLTLTGTAPGATVALNGNATVSGTTRLAAPSLITVSGVQQAGTFTAASDTGISVPGSITATDITLTGNPGTSATIAVTPTGVLTAANSATIAAPGAVTLDGAVAAPTLAVTSATSIESSAALTGKAITLTGTTPASTVTLTGALTDTGTATITGPGGVALSGSFAGGGALTASSNTSVAVNYPQLNASALTLSGTAPGATVSLAGNSTVTGATRLTAPTFITVAGNQQAGTFTAASDSGITVTGAVAATDITLTGNTGTAATVGVAAGGSVTGSNSATISAPGAVTLAGGVSAPTLTVTSGATIGGAGTLSGTMITVTGTGTASTVSLTGAVDDLGTATISAPGAVTLSGTFIGGGALTAFSSTSVAVNYAQLAASGLVLTGSNPGSTVSLGGNSTVTGTTQVAAPGPVTVAGSQQAGTFIAASGTSLSVTGAVKATDITLEGVGTATVDETASGLLAAANSNTIVAPGAVTLAGAITAPTVSVSSGTSIASSGTLSGTTIALTGTGSTSTVTLTGALNDAGTATIAAPGAVALSGTFTGGGALSASSGTSVAVNYPQLNANGLTLAGTAPGATVSLAGNSTVTGTTRLTAPTLITVSGSQRAGTFTVASDAGISVPGSIVATDITLTGNAGTAATVGVTSTGSLAGANSATIAAPGAVTLDGAVAAPTLAVTSATSIESSGTLSGTAITLTGTGTAPVTLTGVLDDRGSATIVAPGAVALSGMFTGGGALNASAGLNLAVNYAQLNASALTLTGTGPAVAIMLNGNSTVTGTTRLSTPNLITVAGNERAGTFIATSASGINVTGAIAATDVTLTGTPGTTAQPPALFEGPAGSIVATNGATFTAPGVITLNGVVSAPTLAASSATQVVSSGALTGTVVTLTGTGPGATVNLSGTLTDTGTATITAPAAVTLDGTFAGGGALSASSAGNVIVNYGQLDASNLTLTGTGPGSTLSFAGNSTVTGTTALSAPTLITVAGSQQAGTFTAASDTGINVTGTVGATDITLTGNRGTGATVSVTPTGALTAANSVTVAAPGAATLAGAVAAPTLAVTSATSIAATALLSGNVVTLTGGSVSLSGPLAETTSATIFAPGGAILNGAITGGALNVSTVVPSNSFGVPVRGSGALTIASLDIETAGAGTAGSVSLTGPIAVGGSGLINAGAAVNLGAPTLPTSLSAGALTINAAGSITDSDVGTIAGPLALTSTGGSIILNGATTAGATTLAAGVFLRINAPLTATTLTGTAHGGLSADALLTADTLTLTDNSSVIVAGGASIAGTAKLNSTGTVSLGRPSDPALRRPISAQTLAINGASTVEIIAPVTATNVVVAGTAGLTVVTIDAPVTVARSFGVTQAETFTDNSAIAAGTISVAASGLLAVNASLAGDQITLGGGSVAVAAGGSVAGTTSATITAPGAVEIDGAVSAPTLALSSGTSVAGAGSLDGASLTITGTGAGSTVTLTGALTDTGTATITGPGGVALSGTFAGGGALTASSNTSVAVNYPQLDASALTLTGTGSGASVTLDGNTSVSGATTLQASAAIVLDGTQQAGTFSATSGTGITVPGSITAGDITLTGTAGTTVTIAMLPTGTLAATNGVTIAAPGAVTLDGTVAGAMVQVGSGTSIESSGSLQATTLTLTGTAPGATIDLGGTSTVSGTTTLAAPGLVTIAGTQQAGTFTAMSDGGIAVAGAIAATDIMLTGTPGTSATVGVTSTGTLAGANSVTVTAPGDVTIDGALSAPTLGVTGGGTVSGSGGLSGTDLAVAGTDIYLTGAIGASDAATITGANSAHLTGGSFVGGALTVVSNGSSNVDSTVEIAEMRLDASSLTLTGTTPDATISLGGVSNVAGATTLNAGGGVTIAGTQQAGSFTASSNSNIDISGTVTAATIALTGNYSLIYGGGPPAAVTVTGTGQLLGNTTIAAGNIEIDGGITGNTVSLSATDDIIASGPLTATTLNVSNNGVANLADVDVGGTATIGTIGGVVIGRLVGGGAYSLTSETSITATGPVQASALTLTGDGTATTVELGGITAVTGPTTIVASGAVSLSGAFTGGGALSASSDTSVAVNYAQLAASTLTLTGTAPGATVSLAGNSTVGGTTTLSAPTLITIGGSQQAGTFTATSDTGISVTGAIAATDVTLTGTAGTGATIGLTPSAAITASNSVTIAAPGAVALDGSIGFPTASVPTLAVTSGTSITSSGQLSGQIVTLAAAGPQSFVSLGGDGPITAIDSLTITGLGGVNIDSTVNGGSLRVVGGSVGGSGALNLTSLDVAASGPFGDVGFYGPISVSGAVGIVASGAADFGVTGHGSSLFAGSLALSSGRALTIVDTVVVGGSAQLTAAGALTLASPFSAGATVLTAGGALRLDAPVTATTLAATSPTSLEASGLLTATALTLTGSGTATPIMLTGGLNVAGVATLATPGPVTIGTLNDFYAPAVAAGTLIITGASAVELAAPVTATDVAITGIDGVTTVSVDAPVHVANSFSVGHAATFTNNAAIDPDNITIDVSGLITVNSVLQADRITLDSGDIAITSGGVYATSLAEFLTSAAKASSATVGGTGDAGGYDLDAGELSRVYGNRILVSTGPLASNHSSSGAGTNPPLDLTVQTLTMVGSNDDGDNLNAGSTNAALAFASSGALNVRGQVTLTSAGPSDAVVLAASGPVRVATPTGGVAITGTGGAPTGELYVYGSQVVAASDATAAALATTPLFDDRATLLSTNDGPLAPAGYLQAGRIEVRAASAFYSENSGDGRTFAGLTTGDGGLGFRAGTIGDAAVIGGGGLAQLATVDGLDTFLAAGAPADVIAYGRQVTSQGTTVTNDAFAKIVRTTTADVTPLSEVNNCLIPGGICTSGAYQGKPLVNQGSATFVRSGTAAGDGRDLITIGGGATPTIITWTPYDSKGTGPVDFLPTGNIATFTGVAGLTGYTVINRVLPADATRPILFDGTTLATLTSTAGLATPGGTVVFFAPGGIVVGPTGVFNVGSLLLTTADPQGLGTGFRLNSAAGSTAGITVQPGALITASTPGGFVDLVAPRVRQDGTVTTAGDALYVAAEEADVTANADGSTAIVLSKGSAVGSDPLLLEHSGTTTGLATAAGGSTIVLAAAGQDAPAQVQAGGTLGYAGGAGQVTIAAGVPTGLAGVSAGTGLAAEPADLTLGASVTSPLVAQATRNITVTTPTSAPVQFGSVSLAFGGDLVVDSPLVAASLAAQGGGTASAVTVNAAVTAPVVGITTAGPVTFAAPVTAATSLSVATPGLLTITSAVDPATIVFNVGDIAIGPTAHVGDAATQEISILTDGGRATSATVGGAAGAGGFDLDASEFGHLQANRILVSTGLGTTTRPLDLHIASLTINGSATTANTLNPDTSLAPAVVFASSGGLFVDGQLAIAGAGATDTLGLLAAGRLTVTLPAGGIGLTSPTGALAGRLYLLGSDVVAASAATQAAVAAATSFADRRSAVGLNDGAVNYAGYIQAGTVDVRAAGSFLNQNSGSLGVYAGISVGAGGLGFRQGTFAPTATYGLDLTNLATVDAAVKTTSPAEVIAFGREVTGTSSIINAAFLPTVRVNVTDVTLPSEINGCPIRGGACRDPLTDGTPMDRAAELTGMIIRPLEDIFIAAGEVNAFIASQVGAFTAPRLIDLSAVTITAGIGDPATGAGDETLWDPLGLVPAATDTPAGPSDGRVGKRPAVPAARPSGSPGQ